MNDGFRGMILTGSNAGGKSTALKSILMSILLGQAWGISPADKAEMTAFSFIGSFMNIKDDLADRTSLFQAEMKRAAELIAISKDVAQKDELRGIVVMDELFTGTSPDAGEEGTEQVVARKLFLNKNLITLFATHYKGMVRLPEEAPLKGQVKNFRLEIYFNEKGRPIPTYRLEEGISEAQIAHYYFERDL
jgi:DNA mismatch repair ATPase MutS